MLRGKPARTPYTYWGTSGRQKVRKLFLRAEGHGVLDGVGCNVAPKLAHLQSPPSA